MFVKYNFKNFVNTFCMLSLCKSKQLYSCSISSYKLGLSPVLSNRLFSTYRTFCRSTCKILKTLIIYLWRKKSEELRRKSKPKLWRQISSKSNALWLPWKSSLRLCNPGKNKFSTFGFLILPLFINYYTTM